jgi:pyridinium-3,5-biscarboxylic acid mononucleotide synthase
VDRTQLLRLLDEVRAGTVAPAEAARTIAALPDAEQIDAAVIDHHRELRTGVPEIVFGESKTAAQIADALRTLAKGRGALATRVDAAKAAEIVALLPGAKYLDRPRLVAFGDAPVAPPAASIAVVCAGTSDLPIADEAAQVARFLGAPVVSVNDVGVAGLHRLLARLDDIRKAEVVIAIAGMEAALPAVLGGLIDRPIIAVPTSVGYGVSVAGLVALGGLLATCTPGITVVNIDNGVGAAVAAVRIARIAARAAR